MSNTVPAYIPRSKNANVAAHAYSVCSRAQSCRFFASIYESKDGGRTWVLVAGDAAQPMQVFNSAMGQMEELNGCLLIAGGYTRQGSAFSYLDSVWRSGST